MSEDLKRLQEHVNDIAQALQDLCDGELGSYENEGEPMNFFEYLEDVLDTQYIVNSDKSYRSCKLLVAFGGPNIWVNTDSGLVEGAWWGDAASTALSNAVIEYIDSNMEELFNC